MRRLLLRGIVMLAVCLSQPGIAQPIDFWDRFDPEIPRHLALAEHIVENITSGAHEYGSRPNFLLIPGLHDVSEIESRNMCASFLTNVLKLSYGLTDYDFKQWSGSTSPYAFMYYRMVEEERGFRRILRVQDLAPGDFVFWYYHDDPSRPGTGHAMMLAETPAFDGEAGTIIYRTIEAGFEISVLEHWIEVDEEGFLLGKPVFGRLDDFVPTARQPTDL